MKRRLDQPPVVPANAARQRDMVFVYALLGSIVTCLLCALSIRLDRSAGANIGWPLQVLLCLIFFVACFVYGLTGKAMWQAMFGAVLGTCVGFFFGLGIVTAAPSDDLPKSQMRLSLAVHNHTADYIHQSYVGEAGSSNVRAYGSSEHGCCVTYPKVWAPYLTAKIRWTTSSSDPNATGEDAVGKWHDQTVFIDEFFAPGSRIHVHFLPESKV